MIRRYSNFCKHNERYIKYFEEIFNIEPKDAELLYGPESGDKPQSEWKRFQEDITEYEKRENALNIPHKNIIFQNQSRIVVFLFDEDKPIVYANLKKFNDGLVTTSIVKSKNSTIKNLGLTIYESIVNDLGLPIYSDMQQTDASRTKIWGRLYQKYPNRIVAYNLKTGKISKIVNKGGNDFQPFVDDIPVYNSKEGIKVNTHGEEDPNNQIIDWKPFTGYDPLVGNDYETMSKMFLENNLYLLKFLIA